MKKISLFLLILSLFISGCSLTKDREISDVLSPEEAQAKAKDFVNDYLYLVGSDFKPEIKNVEKIKLDVYKVTVGSEGQDDVESYLTTDGKEFILNTLNVDEITSEADAKRGGGNQASQGSQEIPKSDKPLVELFVMAFCPYGVQAEGAMAPVVDLLGDKADIEIRYIASASGDSLDSIKSLHGNIEGVEDARQLCVAENYDKDTLWDYISNINKDCYPVYTKGESVYNECWQKAAKDVGINVSKIDSCLDAQGVDLIKEADSIASKYGVTGSPSLVINGVKYNGSRSSEAYKTAICNAFNNSPEECSTKLEDSSGNVTGGCN